MATTWLDWNQTDIPCYFTRQRAEENGRFIEDAFSIIPGALSHPQVRDGRLRQLWHSAGAGAFLEINSLAEDLRLLRGKPGYREAVRDLSDARLCQPTWHCIHVAALFERARPGSVLALVDARSEEAPDLIVQIDGVSVPVEAKLLTESEAQTTFTERAKQLVGALSEPRCRFPDNTLSLLVIKRAVRHDEINGIRSLCEAALSSYSGARTQHRSALCNVFVEPMSPVNGVAGHHAVWAMTPVPATESFRVIQRAKKASRQLRAFPSVRNSGVMAIGLNDEHVGEEILGHIGERIRAGRLSGIAAVLLIKRRHTLDPPVRAPLDILELRKNDHAAHPISADIPLQPLAQAALMSNVERGLHGVFAWRYGTVAGKVLDATQYQLRMPDIRILSPEMIE